MKQEVYEKWMNGHPRLILPPNLPLSLFSQVLAQMEAPQSFHWMDEWQIHSWECSRGLWVFLLIWKTYCFLRAPSHFNFQSMSFNQVYFHCWEKLSHTDIETIWNIYYYITMYNPSLKEWNLSFCAIKGWVRAVPLTPYLPYFTVFPFWLYESFSDEKTKERVSSLTLNASRAPLLFVLF